MCLLVLLAAVPALSIHTTALPTQPGIVLPLSAAAQEAIYSAEKDVQQMTSRVQREQEDLQRRAAALSDTALKQEAEKQQLQMERRSWHDGEAERLRLDAAAREIKQQTQHLKVLQLF